MDPFSDPTGRCSLAWEKKTDKGESREKRVFDLVTLLTMYSNKGQDGGELLFKV